MKKVIILTLICFLFSGILSAQDIIVLKTGLEVKSKVLEITQSEIKYKKFDNLDGPTISVSKSEVVMIRYQNGTNDIISSNLPAQETERSKTESRLNSRPFRMGFYAEPLGIVQFGPHLGAEMTIANHLIIDGHLRFSSIGLLMRVVTADDEEGLPDKLSGTGFGGGFKFLAPSRIGGFYIGALFEISSLTETYAEGDAWVWESKQNMIIPMVSTGYKFRFPSGFYFNTGANLGASVITDASWHYLKNYKNDSSIHKDDTGVHPFGMLEVALGIEF
jgi:hypothetical protein